MTVRDSAHVNGEGGSSGQEYWISMAGFMDRDDGLHAVQGNLPLRRAMLVTYWTWHQILRFGEVGSQQ